MKEWHPIAEASKKMISGKTISKSVCNQVNIDIFERYIGKIQRKSRRKSRRIEEKKIKIKKIYKEIFSLYILFELAKQECMRANHGAKKQNRYEKAKTENDKRLKNYRNKEKIRQQQSKIFRMKTEVMLAGI